MKQRLIKRTRTPNICACSTNLWRAKSQISCNNLNYDFINEDGSTNRVLSTSRLRLSRRKGRFYWSCGLRKKCLILAHHKNIRSSEGSVLLTTSTFRHISTGIKKMIGFAPISALFFRFRSNNLTSKFCKSDKQIAKVL